jgi:hypothetical protein
MPTNERAGRQHRAREAVLSGVKDWKGFHVVASGVGDNATFYECVMEFIATNGQPVRLEQVYAAKWKNDKIVHERFYYDTGKPKA